MKSRIVPLVMTVSAMVFVAGAIYFGGHLVQASPGTGSPAATPMPEGTGEPLGSEPIPPDTGLPPDPITAFAGDVVRIQQRSLFFSTNSPDPNNGRLLFGTVWLEFDDAGRPRSAVAVYRAEDGSIAQTVIQTSEQTRVAYPSPLERRPDGTTICGFRRGSDQGDLWVYVPSKVPVADARARNFAYTTATPPAAELIQADSLSFFERIQVEGDDTAIQILGLDENQFVRFWESISRSDDSGIEHRTFILHEAIEPTGESDLPTDQIEVAQSVPVRGC